MELIFAIILLVSIAILPVYIIGKYLYKKDVNKEPKKILTKLFFSGFGSIVVALLITFILEIILPILFSESTQSNLFGLFFYTFIGVALIEEFSKWIFVYKIGYNNIEFDEFYDIILYATFVALGFACLENILYVLQAGVGTGLLRAVTAVPGHVFDGVFMGYYLGLAKINTINNRKQIATKNIVLSILFPVMTHGLYDYLAFSGALTDNLIFLLLWLILVILMYIFCIKRVMKVSNLTGKFINNNNIYNNQNIINYNQDNMINNGNVNYNQSNMNNNINYNQGNMNSNRSMNYNQNYMNNNININYNQSNGNNVQNNNIYVNRNTSNRHCTRCGHVLNGNICYNCGNKY